MLEFGYGQRLTYSRDGLFLFGPVDSSDQLRTIPLRYRWYPGRDTVLRGVVAQNEGLHRGA
jgi:hypothetical protein